MTGSEAEERLRATAEAAMRLARPKARIVHELQLQQGGVRIDLAAIDEDFLLVAEIKSERDTLARLRRQVERSLRCADEVWAVVALKHAENAGTAFGARLFVEQTDGTLFDKAWRWRRPSWPDPRARVEMLWAGELRDALSRHFGDAPLPGLSRLTRDAMKRLLVEHMTGREIRRAVCAALRARRFPRCDPAP